MRIRRREKLTSGKHWSFGSMLMYSTGSSSLPCWLGRKLDPRIHILSVSPSCYWPAACGGHVLQSGPGQCPCIEAGEASLVTTGEQGHGVAGLQWPHRGVNRVCRERFAEIRWLLIRMWHLIPVWIETEIEESVLECLWRPGPGSWESRVKCHKYYDSRK